MTDKLREAQRLLNDWLGATDGDRRDTMTVRCARETEKFLSALAATADAPPTEEMVEAFRLEHERVCPGDLPSKRIPQLLRAVFTAREEGL